MITVNYNRLLQLLEERNMTLKELQEIAGYSNRITHEIRLGGTIALESLAKICFALDVGIDEVMEFDYTYLNLK